MHLTGTWLTPQPDAEPVQAHRGSSYKSRFVIPDGDVRSVVRTLTSASGAALVDIERAQQLCSKPNATPWQKAMSIVLHPADVGVVLEDGSGVCECEDACRAFLRELGSDSPAIAYTPLRDAELLLQGAERVTAALDAADTVAACVVFNDMTNEHIAHRAVAVPQYQKVMKLVRCLAVRHERCDLCRAICDLVIQAVHVRSSRPVHVVAPVTALPCGTGCTSHKLF